MRNKAVVAMKASDCLASGVDTVDILKTKCSVWRDVSISGIWNVETVSCGLDQII